MPVATDPNEKRRYMLRKDRSRGKEAAKELPKFYFRFLTRMEKGEFLRFGRHVYEAMNDATADKIVESVYEHLGRVLVGWEKLKTPDGRPIEYDPQNIRGLDAALIDRELWELYWSVDSEIDEDDRDFFVSPPDSGPEKSASPENATAA